MFYFEIAVLVLMSGMFSGLTLGVLGLNTTDLEVESRMGNKYAKKILPIRQKTNLVLCTFIIGNVAVNAGISIILGNVASGLVAMLTATILITLFGEILPQATFNRYALKISAFLSPLIKLLIFILYPVAKPLSLFLDLVLGEEGPILYSKKKLATLISLHEDSKLSDIDRDEEKILHGGLTFSNKKVHEVMTLLKDAFCLKKGLLLSPALIVEIKKSGYSRTPIWGKGDNKIAGILYVKDLIDIDPNVHLPIEKITTRKHLTYVQEDDCLDTILNKYLEYKSHLFFVKNKRGKITGLVTLEDVIEEILKTEIVDETDPVKKEYIEHKKLNKRTKNKRINK